MTEQQAKMMVCLAKRLIHDAYHDMDHDDFIESFKLYTQLIKELFETPNDTTTPETEEDG